MTPAEYQFPEFVADQLLTAEDLNNMFTYLDEQERLTRTTMLGIGIICGLKVTTSTDGSKLTISRGAGDTSEGYLMRMEDEIFFEYKKFDALKPKYYDVFVNSTVESNGEMKRTQKFELWEMFSKSETDATELSKEFLADKVVLLFYEMLEIDAKNCDPTSCDDKGRDVQVNIRKLLMKKDDAEHILPKFKDEIYGGFNIGAFLNIPSASLPISTSEIMEDILANKLALPELRLRRFDVAATELVDTNDIYEGYQKILSKNFIKVVDTALYKLHALYRNVVKDVGMGNPFANFEDKFAFLHNGSISGNRLLHYQYYYDLFFDILQAYDELRCLGIKLVAQCCPDSSLFPRHLLLGEAMPPAGQTRTRYRNYFIPSPILHNHADLVAAFKTLYKRLALQISKVEMPVPSTSINNGIDTNIRVTPSVLGNYPLAERAIPFYYRVNDENGPLYQYWGYKMHCKGKPNRVLSYHAKLYNDIDDFVMNPLRYDIEPYNFFRIEGHVGKNYKSVLNTLTSVRNSACLPFDIVALSASFNEGEIDFSKTQCHFHDLEAIYNSLKSELTCLFCREMVYYYAFPASMENLRGVPDFKPDVPLLKFCAPTFNFTVRTFGHEFELLYPTIRNLNDINISFFYSYDLLFVNVSVADPYLLRKALLFYMQKIYEQLGQYLGQYDELQFKFYHEKLLYVARTLRKYLKGVLLNTEDHAKRVELEDEIDHLDVLLMNCTQKPFDTVRAEYLRRLEQLRGLRQLNQFVKKHPGIEHKAGVPKGGTFIVVYSERQKSTKAILAEAVNMADLPVVSETAAPRVPSTSDAVPAPASSAEGVAVRKAAAKRVAYSRNAAVDKIEKLTEELSVLGVSSKYLKDLRDDIGKLSSLKLGAFDAQIANYTDGIVVADFYLPYLCCSDCPPIQYVFTEVEQPLTLSLEQDQFCSNDKKEYVFKVSPAGGTVTGDHVTVTEDAANGSKKFSFNPAAVTFAGDDKERTLVFTYKLDDKTVQFNVKVYRKPVAQFEVKVGSGTSHRQVIADNQSKFGSLYEWDFGEGAGSFDTSTKEHPDPHTYKEEGSYVITLKVINGICADTITKMVTIVPQGAVSIGLDKVEYCNDEKGPFHFTLSLAGITVTGEGVQEVAPGQFAFFPSGVNLTGVDEKAVTFTGTAQDGRKATVNAVVYVHPPMPSFRATRNGTTNEVTLTVTDAPSAKSFNWDFGDGQKQSSANKTISHTYLQNGLFVISLVSKNGPCTSSPRTAEIAIRPVVVITKTCMPLKDIVTDFEKLKEIDPQLFDVFVQQFGSFNSMQEMYGGAGNFVNSQREEQLRFFIKVKIDALLGRWLPETAEMFGSDFRPIAIALYRILVNTSMLVACLKKEDIIAALPLMSAVFKEISVHIESIRNFAPNLKPEEKEILKALFKDLEEELQRIEANNEDKPRYRSVVEKLAEILKSIFA